MPRTFQSASLFEFQDVVAAYPFTRRVTEVHLHHTWRPRQTDYTGLATIDGMWRFHTQTNGWSDIAQHVTIAPDGAIWLCRNFNWAPASARGFNGNSNAGPFMIEMIGDFDVGRETITPEQQQSTLAVIKTIQDHFKLKPQDLRFHNEMSTKSCPGTSFEKEQWIKDIRNFAWPDSRSGSRARDRDAPFPERASRAWDLMHSMNPEAPQTDDMSATEHAVDYEALERQPRGDFFGGDDLTAGMIDALAEHVINLERGKFSQSGRIETTPGDVDRLFEELIPREIEAAKADRRKAQLLFYAHGGLVSEKNALVGAFKQLKFWRGNHVYPLFFIWETSFAETLRQLVSEAFSRSRRARGPLDWITDNVTDNLIEELVRAAGGGIVWGGMQSSAELASAAAGGAAYVADKTAALLDGHGDDVEIHAVGHSAGSIFHAHFMAALADRNAPIKSAHFLAPAIRNDLFHATVAPLLGNGIGPLTIFTMTKRREKDDTVTPAYRKSLLYLIYEALENQRQTDILGLELSLRADHAARDIFGLRGTPSDKGEVVWSPNRGADSGSASDSQTHGGFDDDKLTMESVARRILDRRSGQPIEPFPQARPRGAGDFWTDQFEWPGRLEPLTPHGGGAPAGPDAPAPVTGVPPDVQPSGLRRALCIGIDRYERSPLSGCVADARLWQRTLENLGYETELMTDQAATAAAIRERVSGLLETGQPGDHLVLQFAGHGTQFTDQSGDEAGGDSAAYDECLCAVDCDVGEDGLVIDDELRMIFEDLPDGVSLTCFFDCCHSGTATRAALRQAASRAGDDVRVRYLQPSPAMRQAYHNRLAELRRRQARAPRRQREVLFSACTSKEFAYETNGQGDFTLRSVRVIADGAARLSNRDFYERVLAEFGDLRRQNPELDCDVAARGARFLGL